MEYTVRQLAKMSGVSARTLRYYDQIGLLAPGRIGDNGYRLYTGAQVDLLQQILFYRALGVELGTIKSLVYAPDFDREQALQSHLTALQQKKTQIELLIETVGRTICGLKGEIIMQDEEKFEGFKRAQIDDNEARYGAEIRAAYGSETVDESNRRLAGMTQPQWQAQQALEKQILEALRAAMQTGDPAGEAAQKVCELHGRWLTGFWPDGAYTKQAHRDMGAMYVADERFAAYYETKAGVGATQFLKDALDVYTQA